MKETHDIIDSGILERYLLGELTIDEINELEHTIENNPELKAYYKQLEQDMEKMAMENAITPPGTVKQALLRRLEGDPESKIVPIKRTNTTRSYTGIAATLAVLFLLSSFWLYQEMNSIQDDLRMVREQNDLLLEEKADLEKNYTETVKWFDILNNADTEKLVMRGNDLMPDAKAISYVNHINKTVILNTSGLPKLPAEKDYQLWADVDGEMIDMGVIPEESDMAVMTYIDKAESLNITIEAAGGNDHPTVSQLITNVYLRARP
jgi:anti-sigma-K factor RskA